MHLSNISYDQIKTNIFPLSMSYAKKIKNKKSKPYQKRYTAQIGKLVCVAIHTSLLQVSIRVGATTRGLHWCHSDDLQLFSRWARPVLSPLVLTLIHWPWPLRWCKPIQPKCKGSWPTWSYSCCQLHALHVGLSSTTQWPVPIQQFWWHAQTWERK